MMSVCACVSVEPRVATARTRTYALTFAIRSNLFLVFLVPRYFSRQVPGVLTLPAAVDVSTAKALDEMEREELSKTRHRESLVIQCAVRGRLAAAEEEESDYSDGGGQDEDGSSGRDEGGDGGGNARSAAGGGAGGGVGSGSVAGVARSPLSRRAAPSRRATPYPRSSPPPSKSRAGHRTSLSNIFQELSGGEDIISLRQFLLGLRRNAKLKG